MMTQVPFDRARAAVPKAFDVVGLTSETATVNLFALSCPRASNLSRVVENVSYVLTSIRVEPKNESWARQGFISRYVLDLFMETGEFASYMDGWGIGVSRAQNEIVSVPSDERRIVSWKVTNATRSLAFDYEAPSIPEDAKNAPLHYWFGRFEYVRLDASGPYRNDANIAGVLRMEGTSNTSQTIGEHAAPWTGQSYYSRDEVWTLDSQVYAG